MYHITSHYSTPHPTQHHTPVYTTPHHTTLHHTTPHCTTPHCTTFCTTLHHTASHHTTLHHTTPHHTTQYTASCHIFVTLLDNNSIKSKLHLCSLHNPLLHCTFRDEPKHMYLFLLSDTMSTVLRNRGITLRREWASMEAGNVVIGLNPGASVVGLGWSSRWE